MGIFDPAIFDFRIFDTGASVVPLQPPVDWAPPLVLAASPVIGQALRFLRLAPVARHDAGAELLPALTDAHDQATADLLAAADWTFASTLAVLSPAQAPVLPDDGLPGLVVLPGDLIRLRQFWPQSARWRIDTGVLRHDAPAEIIIRYTARVTREDALPATYKTALALHIAARLAGRFAGSGADPEAIEIAAAVTLKQAMREDSRQSAAARWADGQAGGLIYGADADWALEATA
jgi:hypothetical protein